jgi:NTP pyrophosphatase (non-canonical NTP hydrolase)
MHTPGPWKTKSVFEGDNGWFAIISTNQDDILALSAFMRTSQEEDDANACLIAIAPELLEACKAAGSALRSYQYGNDSPDLAKEIADHIYAVIAKADK